MKTLEIPAFGLENLRITEREIPVPKKGEVLVKIKAVSLNYRDYLTVTGKYNPKYFLPLVPGSDCAGEVVEVGEGVSEWKLGSRVMGNFAQSWITGTPDFRSLRKSTLGGPADGTFTEYRIFPETGLVGTPQELSDEEAATLPCAALTAWSALFVETKIKPGDIIVVQGTGGVSIAALQFAKMAGATVIVTSSSDEKLQRAKSLGADYLINYKTKPNWGKEVRKITGMNGADHIIEVGGPGTLEESMTAVRLFGHISLIGVLAGYDANINLTPVLMGNIRIQGVLVGSRTSFEDMCRAVSAHKIKPVIDKIYPFEEYSKAFGELKAGSHFGKVCMKIG